MHFSEGHEHQQERGHLRHQRGHRRDGIRGLCGGGQRGGQRRRHPHRRPLLQGPGGRGRPAGIHTGRRDEGQQRQPAVHEQQGVHGQHGQPAGERRHPGRRPVGDRRRRPGGLHGGRGHRVCQYDFDTARLSGQHPHGHSDRLHAGRAGEYEAVIAA